VPERRAKSKGVSNVGTLYEALLWRRIPASRIEAAVKISERTFDHGRTFLKGVDVRFKSYIEVSLLHVRFTPESGHG
jgi:hypothetical protein